ncbi:hypothetical protein R3P38DRAFT_3195873 [Favolaschia claudopus]|uniref:Uncharacterized protein n=1 Tax=Favolaschia claudopus TaxID=2862362 RepID=A0AAW0B9W9_9AGAR
MVVIAAGPKALESWWEWVIMDATARVLTLYLYADFSHMGKKEESIFRFGWALGPEGPYPIPISGQAGKELTHLLESPAFKAICSFQNHMYRLYAPNSYAYLEGVMEEAQLALPFEHSIFTTGEIRYGDAATVDDYNDLVAFNSMEAMTVLGSTGGHITFQEDRVIQALNPGNTVIAASGAKRTNFTAVKRPARDTSSKGRRTDKEFDSAPEAERTAWAAMRLAYGKASLKMFAHLSDIAIA